MAKSISHESPPSPAPQDPLHPVNKGKDSMYTNPEPGQNFPQGVQGTDEKGRSFGKYKDHPPGFHGSGPAS